MSRRVEWSEWQRRRRAMTAHEASHAERLSAARRRGGGKPSDPEKDRMLVAAILAERARRANEGTLVRLGPREYVLRPRRTDPKRELDAFEEIAEYGRAKARQHGIESERAVERTVDGLRTAR